MQASRTILDWIKSQFLYSKDLLKSWSSINTFTNNTEGLATLLKILQKDFSQLDGDQTLISLSHRTVVGPGGKALVLPVGDALQIRKRPEASIQIVLTGHIDTVYPPTSPFQEVTEVDNSHWKGPGVTDMKGGLVVMLIALAALEKTPYAHRIGWEIIINPDEEVGSPSSGYLFAKAAKKNHVGLVFEPAFADGAFVSSRKGSATYTVIARGKAAHAGRDFLQGRSAIYALAHYISALEAVNHPETGFSVNVGFIEGGGPVNIVPDFALCKVNIRSTDDIKIETFYSTLKGIAERCQLREGIQIEVTQDTLRLPKSFNASTQKLFKQFESCSKELHIPFQLRESGGVCDGNILSHGGLPTIDSLGVVGGQIHTHDEFILLESLTQRAQLTALYLMKLASGEMHV